MPNDYMSPHEAAEYLRDENVTFRSFAQTLTSMYPYDDLTAKLVDFFHNLCPRASKRSLARRVGNWMADRNNPTSREDLFRIAFALELDEAKLDELLGQTTDYCIQYRDGKELVLAWFLRNGRSYQDALSFFSTLPAYEPVTIESADVHTHITRELKVELANVYTLEGLHAYYLFNMHLFGTQHLRAYYYFKRYLEQLVQPAPLAALEESRYSIQQVVDEYLSMHVPSTRRRTNLTLVQCLIKQGWPNATTVKNVLNRTEDVSRKLLLLLYVITENCGIFDSQFDATVATTMEECVEDHWWILNALLIDCGMCMLDPRNAFDWLVLYAIAADGNEPMSSRMEHVIDDLFGA